MAGPDLTRFAPSPTGLLHLGHAYAAWTAWRLARDSGGQFLLRLEDIDYGRCRPEFESAILDDLGWLGFAWQEPVRRQSERLPVYQAVLGRLTELGLTYPCFCTRAEIAAEIAAMPAAPHGPDGPAYPGTCRRLRPARRAALMASGKSHALRLDAAACLAFLGQQSLAFEELGRGPAGETGPHSVRAGQLSDIVLGRKDLGVSYHLAVVVDDADQQVSLVTRGQDLFGATAVQRLLQAVLGLPAPNYHHHRLVLNADGRRLAKRDRSLTLAALRAAGWQPERLLAGLERCDRSDSPSLSVTGILNAP